MLALLKADLTQVLRNRGVIIWVMAFPIILATIFLFVFGDYASGAYNSDLLPGQICFICLIFSLSQLLSPSFCPVFTAPAVL